MVVRRRRKSPPTNLVVSMASPAGRTCAYLGMFLASVLLAGPPAGAVGANVNWDDPAAPNPHPFVEGFLTASGTSYGISWDAGAPSEDNKPADPTPADPVADTQFRLEGWMNYPYSTYYPTTSGYRFTPPMAPEEFVSKPLPRDLTLNVTRGFQITLYLQTVQNANACMWNFDNSGYYTLGYSQWFEPTLDLELLANGKPIGGAFSADPVSWHMVYPTRQKPVNPTGYVACYYQMHPEVAVLEEGTVLTLKINHARQRYHYPYGLAGEHRSSIRIWEYPAEEIAYRLPELAPSETTEGSGDASSGGTSAARVEAASLEAQVPSTMVPLVGGLALIAGLALPSAARNRRSWLAVAAAMFVLTSGCLAGGNKKGVQDSNTLDGLIDVGERKGDGSIYGLVHDDMHIPIAGVHISILGLADFTTSDGKGRFSFKALLPGVYKLRFDKAEYKSFETEVSVKSGLDSTPSVMLFLKNQKDAGFRIHNHDYWFGATRKAYPAQTLPATCLGLPQACYYQNSFRINPSPDEPNLVLPGTTELELTLEWNEEQLGVRKIGLIADSMFYNTSTFAARGPGEPFHIRTAWEMTDVGHSRFSSWVFYWFVPDGEQRTWEEERDARQPGATAGTITMKATVHRGGRLPLEPAHPDNWKGQDTIDVLKGAGSFVGMKGYLPPSVEGTCLYYYDCSGLNYGEVPFFGRPPISYGTQWVEVTAKLGYQPNPAYSIKLYYKPANVPAHMANTQTLVGFKGIDPLPGATWDKMKFRIPVVDAETDGEYAKSTSWKVTFRVTDEDAWWTNYWVNAYTGTVTGKSFQSYTFDMKAHRDPMPS